MISVRSTWTMDMEMKKHADDPYPWHDLNSYYRNRFGGKVAKVLVNTGRVCPHRLESGGCTFCHETAILPAGICPAPPLAEQIRRGMIAQERKYKAQKYVIYFQRGTNTAAPLNEMRQWFLMARSVEACVALAIGTRPDYLAPEVVTLLQEMAKEKPVFVELGLQSAHDVTLRRIRRGHDRACFEKAVDKLSARTGLEIVVHMILGLPGETPAMMRESFRYLAKLPLSGVKIHHLQVVAQTELAVEYHRGEIEVMTQETYAPLLADVLEELPWRMVIHRLMGDQPATHLLAPRWTWRKSDLQQALAAEFARRKTRQGSRWAS